MNTCPIIILAAGNSKRLGTPKQLLQFNGKSLIRHSILEALPVASPLIVVLGSHVDTVIAEIREHPIQIARNHLWEEGMSTSIQCGLNHLLSTNPYAEKAIFTVCDQPYLSTGILQALILKQQASGQAIVASAYDDAVGIPSLFSRSMFPELLSLSGDSGAKKLIRQHPDKTATIAFPLGSIDIDTMADYEKLGT